MGFILASSSPRRKELLRKVVSDFSIIVPQADEIEEGEPAFIARENAIRKGRAVAGEKVVACDTIVVFGGKIFGKPHSKEQAIEMLTTLSGKTHEVLSGLYVRINDQERVTVETSKVTFNDLSRSQIEQYVEREKPYDKAGAYGIQDGVVVRDYEGSFDNIVGLPTEALRKILEETECLPKPQ